MPALTPRIWPVVARTDSEPAKLVLVISAVPLPPIRISPPRLAIDKNWQGRGLGRSLLRDAVFRTIQAAEIVGIRALLVHAISIEAKRFYQYFGFQLSEVETMTLMATLSDLRDALP